jgi:hypothetical protein
MASCESVGDVLSISARAVSARSKGWGNVRWRLSALRRIPLAAFGLKKNLRGAWGSKMSDNEHTTAPLWDSEVLRVKHPPRHAIPEFFDALDDDSEIFAVV